MTRVGCPVLPVLLAIHSKPTTFVNPTIIEPQLSLGLRLEGDHFFKRDSVTLTAAVQPQSVDLLPFDQLRIGRFVAVESQSHELLLRHHLQLASQVGDGSGIRFQDKFDELVSVSTAFAEA